MRTVVTNSFLRITTDTETIRRLDILTSYPVEGAEFSAAYQRGVWNGRERLMRYSRKTGEHLLPTGLISEVWDLLKKGEVIDQRKPFGPRMKMAWVGPESRDYQTEAIEAALRERGQKGYATGRGLLNLPIRSGKTHIAGRIIASLGLRTLFVVPSDLLLYQTVEAFSASLEPAPVGIFGDGRWEPDWVTIATVQSMLAHPERARELLGCSDLLVVDECVARGSLVRLANGSDVPVEHVVPGDSVATPLGTRKVLRVVNKGIRKTISLRVGTIQLDLTPEHPIGASDAEGISKGWIQADKACDRSLRLSTLRFDGHESESRSAQAQLRNAGACSGADETTQPDARPGGCGENVRDSSGQVGGRDVGSVWRETWRQREDLAIRSQSSRTACAPRIPPSLRGSDGRTNARQTRTLQIGFGQSREDDRYRDRWTQPQLEVREGGRCEEGCLVDLEGVEDDSRQGDIRALDAAEFSSERAVQIGEGQAEVWDIEVEDARCFYANGILVHNCHHLEAPAWRSVLLRSDARYKLGLSATISVSRLRPAETSSIWLKAVTGPILSRISMARLIAEGHIMKPRILIYPVRHDQGENWSYQRAYKSLVEESELRNGAIADLAEDAVRRGLRVLVDTGRIAQMNRITEMLRARGVKVEKMSGRTPARSRWDIIRRLQAGSMSAIVGTVLGEGVDIPELEVVINRSPRRPQSNGCET